jgi:hypothetical protein
VGAGRVLVGDGVTVAGSGVGVWVGTTVGNDWVGVGSRVAVGEPTTRVAVGVGAVWSGVRVRIVGPKGVVVGEATTGRVGVDGGTAGAAARATNPKQ